MNSKLAQSYHQVQKDRSIEYQSLDVNYHPFDGANVISCKAKPVEVFISQRWFAPNPRKWSDLSTTLPPLRIAFLRIVEMFNYWSDAIGPKVREVSQGRFIPYQVVTFEQVMKEGHESPAGYRLRISTQSDTDSANVASITSSLIENNAWRAGQERKKLGRKYDEMREGLKSDSAATNFVHSLTLEEWKRLCEIYTGQSFPSDQVYGLPLSHEHNPVNPYTVFSWDNSKRLAEKAGACAEQTKYDNYHSFDVQQQRRDRLDIDAPITYDSQGRAELDCAFVWPFPELVWRINPKYMFVGATMKVYWPMVEPLKPANRQILDAYVTGVYGPKPTDEQRRAAEFLFSNCITRSAVVDNEPEDFDTLKAKHHAAAQLIKKNVSDPNKQRFELLVLKSKSLNEFSAIYSPEGESTPDAIKALARYFNEYVSEHKSLCMEMPKLSKNLTAFGDEMVMMGVSMQTVWGVNTAHVPLLALFLKQMFVYFGKGFNPHTCFNGPGQAGKSYVFLLCMAWMIQGTFVNQSYSSLKALVVPGNKWQFMNRFHEDVTPSMIGIAGKEKGQDTANTDWEAIMKAMQTSGVLNAQVLDISNGRAAATTADIKAKVNAVINVCTNASASQMPAALRSRYHNGVFQLKDPSGVATKATKQKTADQTMTEEILLARLRRNQVMISIIALLIHCEILPEIDMSTAHIIFKATLDEARDAGLSDVDHMRNFERLSMICQVIVVWDCISTLWDSPNSPFKGQPHDITHFLYCERYLRATVEHATFALGLLSDQYENPITNSILTDLMDTHFKSLRHQEHEEQVKSHSEQAAPTERAKPTLITADTDIPPGTLLMHKKDTNKSKGKGKGRGKQRDDRQRTLDDLEPQNSRDGLDAAVATGGAINAIYDASAVTHDQDYYICPFNPPVKSFTMHNDEDRVRYLASVQLPTMKEKPLLADVEAAYLSLLHRLVPSKKKPTTTTVVEVTDASGSDITASNVSTNTTVQLIPALKFADGRMFLSKSVVRGNKENALRECLRKVVDHKYAKDGEYLYGMHRENTPFLFDTIKCGPQLVDGANLAAQQRKQESKKELKVVNPNYFEPKLISITQRYMRGTLHGLVHGNLAYCEEVMAMMKRTMRSAFRTKHRMLMDMDLNDYAEQIHTAKLNLADFQDMPSGEPWEHAAELREHSRIIGDRLITYPYDLPHATPIKFSNEQNEDFNKHMHTKYSMSQHVKDVTNALKGNDDNHDDEVVSDPLRCEEEDSEEQLDGDEDDDNDNDDDDGDDNNHNNEVQSNQSEEDADRIRADDEGEGEDEDHEAHRPASDSESNQMQEEEEEHHQAEE